MNKREAKQVICSYLAQMLDPTNLDRFVIEAGNGEVEDIDRLWEAVQELEAEMLRRAGNRQDSEEQVTS